MAYRETAHTLARKASTKQRLLMAATALVRDGGFAAASAAAVARESGVATGSIYRHFPNKSELVAEVFRFATEHEIEAAAKTAATQATAANKLIAVIDTFCSRAFESKQLAYALIAEPVDPRVELERLRYRHAWAAIYQDIVELGIKERSFVEQDSSVSAAALVGALAESLVGPLGHAYSARLHASSNEQSIKTDSAIVSLRPNISDKHEHDNSHTNQRQLIRSLTSFALRAIGDNSHSNAPE